MIFVNQCFLINLLINMKLKNEWFWKYFKDIFQYQFKVFLSFDHFLDNLLDLDMADPPDLIDIDPLEDIKSTELGALLWISILFYLRTSSNKGPNSGRSSPRFIIERTKVLFLSFSISNYSWAKWGDPWGISIFFLEMFFIINSKDF